MVEANQSRTVTPALVLVVADDLIWTSRLVGAVKRAGAVSQTFSTLDQLAHRLELGAASSTVIVDLAGRAFDGVAAVRMAVTGGATVLAVGQHEDVDLRRRALAAGARRVLSYNKLYADGPQVVAALLAGRY